MTMTMARNKGYSGIFIYGYPKYYHRFGFINAANFGIATASGENFEEIMGLRLFEGGLFGIKGRLHQAPEFEVNKVDFEVYENTFR